MKIPFAGGSYVTRNPIASVETQINLYAEPNPPDAPFPITLYPTPGLDTITNANPTLAGPCRGIYFAYANNTLYAIFGAAVVTIEWGTWNYTEIGTITAGQSMCGITDNQQFLVIVDGSNQGWTVDLSNNTVALINDTTGTFVGSIRADYIDTYLIFHNPGANRWYCTESNSLTFNPLFYAEKTGYNDGIVTIAALHDCVWVFGNLTTEIWYNAGNPQFPFARMPQSIMQYGCLASRSVVVVDNAVYWLSQDRAGSLIFMRGQGYQAQRVSNFAVEQQWLKYPWYPDATAFAYQAAGHIFIVLQFLLEGATAPGGNVVTWVYDASTGFWHQRLFNNNTEGWLPWCGTSWLGNIIVGDRTFSRLFLLDLNNGTDSTTPILRERTWPHTLADQKRMSHTQFVAAMQGTNLSPDTVSLSWSDDGGQTFNPPVTQTVHNASNGQYSWRRLGLARDRVYRLNWSGAGQTALNGAWLEAEPAET